MSSEKKNVIIVGGGNAGTHTAWELSQLDKSRFNLILLNERPFYAHLPALARIAVSDLDKMADRAIFGYDTLFVGGNGTAKVGKVVEVAESAPGQGGEVVLEDGERIPYAALVLATGSRWPAFMSLPKTEGETKTHIASWRDDFKAAEHVVIVGGGAVGVGEFLLFYVLRSTSKCSAAKNLLGKLRRSTLYVLHKIVRDTVLNYPQKKKVTIIHKDSMLLNDVYPAKFRKDLEKRTRAFGIDLILGDAVEGAPGKVSGVKTRDGKSIADADLVVRIHAPFALARINSQLFLRRFTRSAPSQTPRPFSRSRTR